MYSYKATWHRIIRCASLSAILERALVPSKPTRVDLKLIADIEAQIAASGPLDKDRLRAHLAAM